MAERYVSDSDGCGKPNGGALFRQHYTLDSDGQGSTCNTCKESTFVCECPHAAATRSALVDELGKSPPR